MYPGSTGPAAGRGSAELAAPALAVQGIQAPGIIPTAPPETQALSELVQMLKGGQVGAERFLELLSLLAGQAVPQMDSQPGGPQAPQMSGPGDIAGLLGG